jgi:exodeoxyribonuclease-5
MEKELRSNILRFFGMEPTKQQRIAIDKLVSFSFYPNRFATFVLSGYAGTGKTTLLGAYIKGLKSVAIKSVLLAPTGRAAKVLSSKSKRQVFTIHKKIYRKRALAGGLIQLELAPNLSKNTVFIIDEASMIGEYSLLNDGGGVSRNLLQDVFEFVFSSEGCRLVLVGDEGQLPPVGSDYSPALDLNYLKNSFFGINLFDCRLTEVVRQSLISDILRNASNLRSYEGDSFPKIVLTVKRDVIPIEGGELQDYLETEYSNLGADDVVIITKSNKRTNTYNLNVRSRILYLEEEINGGDRLMVVRNNYFWLEESSEAGFIANGEMLKLIRIISKEFLYGFNFVKARVELIDYPQLGDFETVLLIDTLQEDGPSLSREKMKQLFFAIEEEYLHERNKKKRYELITKNPYFNALQVKYAYAITCHKAQGGQWPVVFLDHDYLVDEMLDKSFLRWLYTGFTRASEKLYLVNFNKAFFDVDF